MIKSLYFSHDHGARNDPKLMEVREELGMTGVGIYWCVVEILHEQGGYILNERLKSVAYDLRISMEELGAFFEVTSRGDDPLFMVTDDDIASQSALDRMAQREKISKKNSENAKDRWKAIREKKTKKVAQSEVNATPSKAVKTRYRDNVTLLLAEKNKLVKAHGQVAVDWMLDTLDNYKLAHGKKYKSDYGAINSWVKGKYAEQFPNKTEISL